jgi:N-methylhydantoinase B
MRAVRTLKPTRLCFLDERQRTQPWGLHGGCPAAPNDAYVRRADGTIVMLPSKFDYFQMEPGDVFVVRTGGGGGNGDPAGRDPELVREETAAGLLTVEQARDWFGVVLAGTPLRVDAAATDALREVMPARSELVDRGTPQRTPGPGEYWEIEDAPRPWPQLD